MNADFASHLARQRQKSLLEEASTRRLAAQGRLTAGWRHALAVFFHRLAERFEPPVSVMPALNTACADSPSAEAARR